MINANLSLLSLFFIASIMLSGCATQAPPTSSNNIQTVAPEQRAAHLLKNKKWQLRGKIAFIQKRPDKQDKRESASIFWQVDESESTQTLDLTSYLGINVLHLSSMQGEHFLNVDGEEYHSNNLSQLIYSLTGLTLPTEALNFWLKGLPYQTDDQVVLSTNTQLPASMTSNYHNASWHISYDKYKVFNQLPMATKFTIKKDGLLIKISIKQWTFTDKSS
ncbi:MAG: lipoprotein insertase outer membrane protein LolB [Colwellia sp.]|nr:lipoprotein insertase outer membrane protein LolB [Colwellia sp.]MCW8865181.1 lipoprotein insertase outer membrane protein LolB [Colwellia sp.]MCW9082826.1 lipoprotein insertase outer membrane protein LolB [Colwellia sp.]